VVAGAAAALDPAVGEGGGEGVLGPPAGAVSGYEQVGCQVGERVDGGGDDRGEVGAAEVQAAEQGVQPGDAGEPLGVPDDVDGAGVAAAGHDDQSLAAQVHHQGLVVQDQRVGFPGGAGPVLVGGGHAVFEVGGAVDLAGDQDGAVEEQGRLAAPDHVEALAGQRVLAEGGPVAGPAAGPGQAAAGPHQRVDDLTSAGGLGRLADDAGHDPRVGDH